MAKKLKIETMQNRTADHKQLTIDELEYCKRLIDTIIKDVKLIDYKDMYEPSAEHSKGKYAAEFGYKYMTVIRSILSRYWKNEFDLQAFEKKPHLGTKRLERHNKFMDKMWEVVKHVDTMDTI